MLLNDDRWAELLERRATEPLAAAEALRTRRRRPLLTDGRLFIVAADHTARGMLGVGADPFAMADRRRLLEGLLVALAHPGVDGVLGSADVLEELALLGALDDRLAFGTMNRGGLQGARWELDDRMTAYDADGIASGGLDGGKVLLRIADDDAGTAATLQACADAVSALARHGLPIMVEPLPYHVAENGRAMLLDDDDKLLRAVAVAAGLGTTSTSTWLKVPAGPRRGADARRDDVAGADPGRRAGPRPRGDVRLVGAGHGRAQRSRAGRRPRPPVPAERRRGGGHRPSSTDRAPMNRHRPAGTLADGGDPVALTPQDAGWARSGLRVLQLADGETRTIETGDDEVADPATVDHRAHRRRRRRALRVARSRGRLRPRVGLRVRRPRQHVDAARDGRR